MNPRRTLATTGRILTQIRHDPRTIALLLIVPSLLVGLVAWIFADTPVFSVIGPAILALFPFIVMFLITSITTLRERRTGTLERLLCLLEVVCAGVGIAEPVVYAAVQWVDGALLFQFCDCFVNALH